MRLRPQTMNKLRMLKVNTDSIQEYLRALKEQVDTRDQMVVCTVPSNRKDRYQSYQKVLGS